MGTRNTFFSFMIIFWQKTQGEQGFFQHSGTKLRTNNSLSSWPLSLIYTHTHSFPLSLTVSFTHHGPECNQALKASQPKANNVGELLSERVLLLLSMIWNCSAICSSARSSSTNSITCFALLVDLLRSAPLICSPPYSTPPSWEGSIQITQYTVHITHYSLHSTHNTLQSTQYTCLRPESVNASITKEQHPCSGEHCKQLPRAG